MTQQNLKAPDLEGKDNPDANDKALSPDGSPLDAAQGVVPPEAGEQNLKLELEKEKLEGKRLKTELAEANQKLEELKKPEQPQQEVVTKPFTATMTDADIAAKIAYGTDDEKLNAIKELRGQVKSEILQSEPFQKMEIAREIDETVKQQHGYAAEQIKAMGYNPAEEYEKFAPAIIQSISKDPNLQKSPEAWYLKWLELKTRKGEIETPGASRAANVEPGGVAPAGGSPTVLTPHQELEYKTYNLAADGVTREEYAKTCQTYEEEKEARR